MHLQKGANGLLYWFVLVAVVTIASFMAMTLFIENRARQFDRLVLDITTNAIPNVTHLAKICTEVWHVQAEAEQLTRFTDRNRPVDRASFMLHRELLDQTLATYQTLTVRPGERAHINEVRSHLAGLDTALERALDTAAPNNVSPVQQTAAREISSKAAVIDGVIGKLVAMHLNRARLRGMDVARARRRVVYTAFTLDVSVAAVAAVAAALALRSIRREWKLRDNHEHLLETRSRELELFTSRVAHDIKGPLATVGLSVEVLARWHRASAEELDAAAARCRRSLGRVVGIVDGLLEFARSGAHPEPGARADIPTTLSDLIEELRPAAVDSGVELTAGFLPACAVACSPGVLASLVSNLVRNAIDYIGDGPERRVCVRAFDRGASVRVEVEDTGPGVPAELGMSVFEPYVRARESKRPGLGLGLAIVKRLAEQHGGSIGLEHAPGRGSLFWFELPRVVDPTSGVHPMMARQVSS